MVDNMAMEKAILESRYGLENGYKDGGPFGAVIVKDGKIICSAHNTVIKDKDATAHAEINAIRLACKKLGTHDLSGCALYTSTEPCPMCLSAIIWANIKEVYYSNTRDDAESVGFRDNLIYEHLSGKDMSVIKLYKQESEDAKEVFNAYKNMSDKLIY